MSTTLFSQRLKPSSFTVSAVEYVCKSCRRNAATYRRTRKALRVKLNPAFAPSETETQDHIIFNPPSSAPNVYHTPPIFLPKSDPRRALHTAALQEQAAANAPKSALAAIAAARLSAQAGASAPPVRPIYEKKYHLKEEHVEEIRRLRAEDPRHWTRYRLAEKFGCSPFFISLCCSAPEIKAEQDQKLMEIKRQWGRRKREAREDRQERKKLWGRDA